MQPGLPLFILAGLAVVGFVFVSMYNRLVSLRTQLERAWSNIDVILKQRFDEIPQLIQVIEQYASYESSLLTELAAARQHYGAAREVSDKIAAAGEMQLALRGVMALGEAYPELKANENFVQLQTRISKLEDAIADRRESYNEIVALFNFRIEAFPDVLAARLLNYRRQTMFEALATERVAPSLKMNLPQHKRGA